MLGCPNPDLPLHPAGQFGDPSVDVGRLVVQRVENFIKFGEHALKSRDLGRERPCLQVGVFGRLFQSGQDRGLLVHLGRKLAPDLSDLLVHLGHVPVGRLGALLIAAQALVLDVQPLPEFLLGRRHGFL